VYKVVKYICKKLLFLKINFAREGKMNIVLKLVGLLVVCSVVGCTTPNSCLFDATELMAQAESIGKDKPEIPRHVSHDATAEVTSRNGSLGCFAGERASSGYNVNWNPPREMPPQQMQQMQQVPQYPQGQGGVPIQPSAQQMQQYASPPPPPSTADFVPYSGGFHRGY
jgi:hypothetical protein